MNDKEKFEGFKAEIIRKNETEYGQEARRKYGNDRVNAANAKVKGMTQEKIQEAEALRKQIEETLSEAFALGDPAGESAQTVCRLHKQWLKIFWPDGMYSKEAHKGLADLYVQDDRFKANYEKIAPGCTEFLRDAVHIFCK